MIQRAALWVTASSSLLLVSFSLVVGALYALMLGSSSLEPEKVGQLQLMMTFYFRIVFIQGLLPGLLCALAIWPFVARLMPGVREGRGRLFLGLLLASALAYALVAPSLLTMQSGGAPGLRMQDASDQVASAIGVVGSVAVGAWLPRAFLSRLR